MGHGLYRHTYRLCLAGDGRREAQDIQFEADEPYSALTLAKDFSNSRPGVLFEDGRRLAEIQYVNGFWEIA